MRALFVGTGSHVPEQVTNETLFKKFHDVSNGTRPCNRDGKPLNPDWPERYFGIKSRCLDLSETAMSDTDLAVKASSLAMKNGNVYPLEIGTIIHVSQTPDALHFQTHMAAMIERLGLPTHVHAIYLDIGCAALGPAFREVQANLLLEPDKYVLLVCSQCVSPLVNNAQQLCSYLMHPTEPFAWLQAGTVFSDAAAAVVCKLVDNEQKRGILRVWSGCNPKGMIATFENGFYLMNGEFVRKNFVLTMTNLFNRLKEEWNQYILPLTKRAFSIDQVKRWYFHQANAVLIKEAIAALNLPSKAVPFIVQTEGNSSAVSTLRLLDSDRRQGIVESGDLVVCFWTGAGNGAQYGYSIAMI